MIQLKFQLFISCDILFTPARLDCANEELVMKLKCQLKETQGVGWGLEGDPAEISAVHKL